jgi:N-acetylneuraminic acid mutarotase
MKGSRQVKKLCRVWLEELEPRLVPATSVVFFESSVADYPVLRQGLAADTEAVVLDSRGNGLSEMAGLLAGCHDLSSIAIVAHGAPACISLGTRTLDEKTLSGQARELAIIGSALEKGGELDLWSCDVARGTEGEALVHDLTVATGAAVAASDAPIGSASLGGTWQLDVRADGAYGQVPFSAAALGAFRELLGSWSAAAPMSVARYGQTTTLLPDGKVLVVGGEYDTGQYTHQIVASAELYDPATNTWSSAASMPIARVSHTATLLNNGKVLIVGGTDAAGFPTDSVELYDPASNTWSEVAAMPQIRTKHTATLLPDGRVLIACGVTMGANATSVLYDPATDTWSAAGALLEPLGAGCTATLLLNNKVLVVGSFASQAELYDPATNTWSSAGSLAQGRFSPSATLLANGQVLVAGGFYDIPGHGGQSLASAELYDPASNTWSPAGSMAVPRYGQTAILLPNGQVLVEGGIDSEPLVNTVTGLASAELYDPATNSWSAAGSVPTGPGAEAATLLNNGQVLVTGGGGAGGAVPSADLYDPGLPKPAGTWSATASMSSGRDDATATLLPNGKVLVVGGTPPGSTSPIASAELYDPASGTWTSAGSMVTPRVGQTATLLKDGLVLVAGGFASSHSPVASAELYDPATNMWSPAADMSVAREWHTATLLANGQVLVAGGQGSNRPLNSAAVYDPANNTWSATGDMLNYVDNHTATLLPNGKVLVAGGNAINAQQRFQITSAAELYDPATNTWSAAASMLTAREFHSTTLLNNGLVLVVGGSGPGPGSSSVYLASAELYDPISNSWSSASSMATARKVVSATLLNNGQVLVEGGLGYAGTLAGAELYDPTSNTWTSAGYMASARMFQTATLLNNGQVLVAGGDNVGDTVVLASAELYTPSISSAVTHFQIGAAGTALLGAPTSFTVTAEDQNNLPVAGYTGKVHFTSTDAAASLPADATLTNGMGIFSVTFNTAGGQTITASDTVNSGIAATTNTITVTPPPLTVASFTPTPTGFTATFNEPLNPADLTMYGTGLGTVQDATLVGKTTGPISGTLLVDPTNTSITFKATANGLSLMNNFGSVVLPDDTYTVTLVSGTLVSGSGSNGFMSALGARLDGAASGGHANYVTTFGTNYQANVTPVLSIPDFARGPDAAHNIQIPNGGGNGIPITLYNAAGVTDVTFTLSYNPALLTVSGAGTGDSSAPGSTFTMTGGGASGTATFTFHNASPQSGMVVLGDILAAVPSAAVNLYKAKELLQLGNIAINHGAITGAVSANGVHVNAYGGDVTGNGSIDALDVALADTVAQGKDTGFAAYPLLDPAIVGDVAGDYSVDAGDASDLAAYVSNLPTSPIPAIPGGLTITPAGPDPTLSLAEAGGVRLRSLRANGGVVNVSVQLDQPRPAGSSGMTEATLALKYDPSVLSVSSSDISLGSIPGVGTGWQLASVIDQMTGQIAITLYSTTPINANNAGSLVNIAFHIDPAADTVRFAHAPLGSVQLVSSVTVNGEQFVTQVDDAQGQYVLSPGLNRLQFGMGRGYRGPNRKTRANS